MSARIYFDYAATTPLRPAIAERLLEIGQHLLANPSSRHQDGQWVRAEIELSRQQAANFLGVRHAEIIFTSGATEANNLLLRGLVEACRTDRPNQLPHLIVSGLEHPSILETATELNDLGLVELSIINPNQNGLVDVAEVKAVMRPNTVLISIMLVSNEVGTIQSLKEICHLRDEIRLERMNNPSLWPIFVHTDAVQAAQYINLQKYPVDSLTISAHKCGGPLGLGILMRKLSLPLRPIVTGGAQENGLRSGTENSLAIIAGQPLWPVLADGAARDQRRSNVGAIRDEFEQKVIAAVPNCQVIGASVDRSAHISAIAFESCQATTIQLKADLAGLSCSVGSACSSGADKPSASLHSLGLPAEVEASVVRFSFAETTSTEEIDRAVNILAEVIQSCRA